MAKKTFDNLNPKKKVKKASNETIEAILSESSDAPKKTYKKQKLIQFNVKLPENIYSALDEHSNKTGLSKKAIVVQALLEKLDL